MPVKSSDMSKKDGQRSYSESKRAERQSLKSKKEKTVAPPTKVVIRRLPPTMTEEEFREAIAPLPEHDYFTFCPADNSLSPHAFTRAYINIKNPDDIITFRDKFDGYVLVDQKGNEFPAMVEFAPFQKIPKRSSGRKRDARCATIEQDADYKAFLESLANPESVTLPPLEALLEEIQEQDRLLKANNGLIKVKTPLLEFVEHKKAEKLRSKEEKREERRRKEFERKKAREEEKRKKKEVKEQHREMKRKEEHKEDTSVKLQVLRPERFDYSSEVKIPRKERERDRSDKEKQHRVEEDRQKKERDKGRPARRDRDRDRDRDKDRDRNKDRDRDRDREREERTRKYEERIKIKEEERAKQREEEWEEERQVHYNKPEGAKTKRYSEGRRKEERERERRMKEEKDKVRKNRDSPAQEPTITERDVKERVKDAKEMPETVDASPSSKGEQKQMRSVKEEKIGRKERGFKEERSGEEARSYKEERGSRDERINKCGKSGREERVDEEERSTRGERSHESTGREQEGKDDSQEDRVSSRKKKEKDPRVERRIRNKDRPAMALYRPGQSRLSSRLRQDREEGADTSSSSPSPVMANVDTKKTTKKESSTGQEGQNEEGRGRGAGGGPRDVTVTSERREVMVEAKSEGEDQKDEGGSVGGSELNQENLEIPKGPKVTPLQNSCTSLKGAQNDGRTYGKDTEDDTEMLAGRRGQGMDDEGSQESKFHGVKTMTFRRSVSRE